MGSGSATPATSPHTSQLGPSPDGINLGAVAGGPLAVDGAESKPAGPGLPGSPSLSPPPSMPIGKGAKLVGKGGNLMLSRGSGSNKAKAGGGNRAGGAGGRGGMQDDAADSGTLLVQGKNGEVSQARRGLGLRRAGGEAA